MAYVIKELSIVNNFTHIRYGNPDHRLISRKDQVKKRSFITSQKYLIIILKKDVCSIKQFILLLLGKDDIQLNEGTAETSCV